MCLGDCNKLFLQVYIIRPGIWKGYTQICQPGPSLDGLTRNKGYLSAMRYWREVNNDDEQEEKEEALPLEVKEEQEERQKEGEATLRIKMTVIISWNFYEGVTGKP